MCAKGEIIPSAIFTGKSQLRLAALFAPLVRLAMWWGQTFGRALCGADGFAFGMLQD
eukprot:SAG31_NODE_33364_length_344_cov_1.265306_1_plen_56_part_01